MFRELHATVLRVENFEAMLEWYTTVLGLKSTKVLPEFKMAVLDLPGPSYLCLYSVGEGYEKETHPKCLLNWRTEDIHDTRERLVDQGVGCTEIMETPGFSIFRFHDPEGTAHDCCWYNEEWLPEKK